MNHPKPYPRCMWCDAKANSREHAIPGWIAKRLKLKGTELHGFQYVGMEPRKQPISLASYRARIFCKPCNTHFKHLEDAALHFIQPMAEGRTFAMGPETQRVIALWGAKTAMALITASPELREWVPQDHRDSVRYAGEPPRDCWVGYMSWKGKANLAVGDVWLENRADDDPTRYDAYTATFTFAKLALKVVGFMHMPAGHEIATPRPAIRRVWPPQQSTISWPPPHAAEEKHLLDLIQFVPLRAIP